MHCDMTWFILLVTGPPYGAQPVNRGLSGCHGAVLLQLCLPIQPGDTKPFLSLPLLRLEDAGVGFPILHSTGKIKGC